MLAIPVSSDEARIQRKERMGWKKRVEYMRDIMTILTCIIRPLGAGLGRGVIACLRVGLEIVGGYRYMYRLTVGVFVGADGEAGRREKRKRRERRMVLTFHSIEK
jgi:hypothetical protein